MSTARKQSVSTNEKSIPAWRTEFGFDETETEAETRSESPKGFRRVPREELDEDLCRGAIIDDLPNMDAANLDEPIVVKGVSDKDVDALWNDSDVNRNEYDYTIGDSIVRAYKLRDRISSMKNWAAKHGTPQLRAIFENIASLNETQCRLDSADTSFCQEYIAHEYPGWEKSPADCMWDLSEPGNTPAEILREWITIKERWHHATLKFSASKGAWFAEVKDKKLHYVIRISVGFPIPTPESSEYDQQLARKHRWALHHGSERLRLIAENGLLENSDAAFRDEYIAREYPGWEYSSDGWGYKPRNPPLDALKKWVAVKEKDTRADLKYYNDAYYVTSLDEAFGYFIRMQIGSALQGPSASG